jgi:hypothetical protein
MTALRLSGDSLRLPLKPLAQKSEVGLECDKRSGNSRAWLPKKSSSAQSFPLDETQNPYYCRGKYPDVSAVLPGRPCLALHRRSLPVHAPLTAGKASAPVGMMTPVISNENVTVTDHACPQHPLAPRGCLRRAETTA